MADNKQSFSSNSQKGLGSDNMDEQTKKDIQSKGGQASHGGGQPQNDDSLFESGMNQSESSSESRGFGTTREQGRNEDMGGISSQGDRSSDEVGRGQKSDK